MTTASTAALVLASGSVSQAQTAGDQWWVSIEGEYQFINGDALDFYDMSAEPKDGWSGRAEFGGPIGGGWSAALGVRYGKANKEKDSLSSSYYYSEFSFGSFDADMSYKEDHLVIDLEIGRNVGLGSGGATARVFGGLRFARFDGDGRMSGSGSYSSFYSGGYGSVDVDTTHRFTGIGPRIGADIQIPVANNVRADIGIAGAALYGKRKLKISGNYSYSGFSSDFSDKDTDHVIVPNIEASVALTYLLGTHASLSAGVRAEQYFNMMPTVDNFSNGKDDRFTVAPFIQLTITGN